MSVARVIRRRMQSMVAPSVFLLLTGYFCWQATQGARGLDTYADRHQQLVWAQKEQAATFAERDALEHRVNNLRPQHLDADTLDERVRQMLNYADPSDVVVQYGPNHKLF